METTRGLHEGGSSTPNTTGISSQVHHPNRAISWRMTGIAFVGNEASRGLESAVCLWKGKVRSTYADTELKREGWMEIDKDSCISVLWNNLWPWVQTHFSTCMADGAQGSPSSTHSCLLCKHSAFSQLLGPCKMAQELG